MFLLKPANKMSALISDNPPQIHPRIFYKYKKKQTTNNPKTKQPKARKKGRKGHLPYIWG